MFVGSAATKPMYQVSYERAGKTYQSSEELLSSWTPDTLQKALQDPQAVVRQTFTKLRNHTVGEALKATAADVGAGSAVFVPVTTVAGCLIGCALEMLGHQGAVATGVLSGAGFGLGFMALAAVTEYRSMRNDAGTITSEFAGPAYRHSPESNEVRFVRGDESRKLGFLLKDNLPTVGFD